MDINCAIRDDLLRETGECEGIPLSDTCEQCEFIKIDVPKVGCICDSNYIIMKRMQLNLRMCKKLAGNTFKFGANNIWTCKRCGSFHKKDW